MIIESIFGLLAGIVLILALQDYAFNLGLKHGARSAMKHWLGKL